MRPVIYIAGPYSKGDVAINVKMAMKMANTLIDKGYSPICPHLSHFLHMQSPKPYETWLSVDDAQVLKCDALLRIPGESSGADKEVDLAIENEIPVFLQIKHLDEYFKSN